MHGRVGLIAPFPLFTLLLTGCYTWQAIDPPAREAKLGRVRVVLRDSTIVEINHALARNDSIFGTGPESDFQFKMGEDYWKMPVALPLEKIARIEKRRIEAGRSAAGIGVGVGFVLFFYVGINSLYWDLSGGS